MALDTRAKRMSAILVGKPFRGGMVHAPDSGFSQGDRQASAFMYSGILAIAAVVNEVRMILAGITLSARISGELSITPRMSGTPDLSQGDS